MDQTRIKNTLDYSRMTNTQELYQRQGHIQRLKPPLKVAIVGTGGIGSWVAIFCALAGVETLYLFDDDRLETHNLNRLPFTLADIGQKKVKVLAEFLTRIRPHTTIYCHEQKFDPLFIDQNLDLLFCTADGPEVESATLKFCQQKNIEWICPAASQNHITLTNRQNRQWSGGNEGGGYEGIPIWVAPVVLSAILAVYHACWDRGEAEVCLTKKIENLL